MLQSLISARYGYVPKVECRENNFFDFPDSNNAKKLSEY
jgi:hypothetical protein